MKTKGDCYQVAGRRIMENTHLLLCHGVIIGQGLLNGRPIGHAWNELGDLVGQRSVNMKCKNCGKGRPTFWVEGKGFCNEGCYKKWCKK